MGAIFGDNAQIDKCRPKTRPRTSQENSRCVWISSRIRMIRLIMRRLYHFLFIANRHSDTGKVLDKHIQEFCNFAGVQQEIMISILFHVLKEVNQDSGKGRYRRAGRFFGFGMATRLKEYSEVSLYQPIGTGNESTFNSRFSFSTRTYGTC